MKSYRKFYIITIITIITIIIVIIIITIIIIIIIIIIILLYNFSFFYVISFIICIYRVNSCVWSR